MARPVKSERDKIAAKARKMTSEADKAEWRAAWLRLLPRLPADRSDVAREVMLRALVDCKSIAEAEEIALRSVTP